METTIKNKKKRTTERHLRVKWVMRKNGDGGRRILVSRLKILVDQLAA